MNMSFTIKSILSIIASAFSLSLAAAPASDLSSSSEAWLSESVLVDAAFKVVATDLGALKRLIEVEHVSPNAKKDGVTLLGALFDSLNVVYWHPIENWKAIEETTSYLLAMGADPNMHFSYGGSDYTLLQFAAYDGNLDMVQLLANAGANVNGADAGGRTALHAAAKCDFRLSSDDRAADTIAFLLSRGADVRAKDAAGKTALDRAPTPCSNEPALCEASAIATEIWPTGTCKETYLLLKSAVEAAQ